MLTTASAMDHRSSLMSEDASESTEGLDRKRQDNKRAAASMFGQHVSAQDEGEEGEEGRRSTSRRGRREHHGSRRLRGGSCLITAPRH
jgi:hypothetical protein